MQIEKLCLDIYPRSSWQSMDLGCQMAMRWWLTLSGYWLCVTLPVFLICIAISVAWGPVVFWLFKPWYERGLLYILSRRVFGENVTIKQTLSLLYSQIKPLWFSSITWRRLSPYRGFNQAVYQLEGLGGSKMQPRLSVLHRNANNNAVWWFIICAHWELIIVSSLGVLFSALIPQGVEMDLWDMLLYEDKTGLLLYALALYIAVWLVAPFFIAGSFAIYLNRRVNLEGWDIELGFKKLRSKKLASSAPAWLLVVGIALSIPMYPNTALATQEQASLETELTAKKGLENSEVKQQLKQVMNNPPFSEEKVVQGWRWKVSEDKKEESDSFELHWLTDLFKTIASGAELVLWVIFVTFIGLIIWFSRHYIAELFAADNKPKKSNSVLPDFVKKIADPDEASYDSDTLEQLINTKQYRQLLSILLVLSLRYLCERNPLELTESMTEKECLAAIQKSVPEAFSAFMAELFTLWIALAWAHVTPTNDALKRLYMNWQTLFAQYNEDKLSAG